MCIRDRPQSGRLWVALCPYQVDPPWQAFRQFGGISPIHRLDFEGDVMWLNGQKAIFPLTVPTGHCAASFAQGGLSPFMGGEPHEMSLIHI